MCGPQHWLANASRVRGCLPILIAESAGTLGYSDRSVQTQNNRTIDGEVRGGEWTPGREASDQTVLHEGEDLEFFSNLPAKAFVDCIVVHVNNWASHAGL